VTGLADEAQLREYLRKATIELAEERGRTQALRHEPIAIVGMACRFPGDVSSPRDLWELVEAGVDAIGSFPTDRGWDLEHLYHPDPDNPGTVYVREGGFLADAADFDPAFFGIGPREALEIDPQQRLLLETCWQALEDGGIVPATLRRSKTGVFAGVAYSDYGWGRSLTSGQVNVVSAQASSVIAGRVAYTLGLEGPAMSVDTACSSSLVTLHLAAQALRQGECDLALAGGVTVLSTPVSYLTLSRQRVFAPDGRSKSFAEAADGAGWSEGAGILVLERLSEAQRNGHPVLATIRGSAVNQDGASNGLSAPNGPSQERVIRQALASARLEPGEVDAVEAHGTGTPLGDPIEAGALLATYGQGRERPLRLGSVKSNIGHAQAAAGVAGVIKMVMAMREGVLPKTLHVDAPSSKIDWPAGEVELLTEAAEWQAGERPRRAAVSSFGVSGTNAHVILEQAPVEEERAAADGAAAPVLLPGQVLLPLSAKSEPALRAQAQRLVSHLERNPGLDPLDVAYSLATTRTAFEHRAVAVGGDREQLLAALGAMAGSEESPRLVRGVARNDRRPVFLFGGHGSQWPGMALELYESSPRFAAHMRECEEALSPHIGFTPLDNLRREDEDWLGHVDLVQPTLFALAVSIARLWQDLGVSPAAVAGHSQGEVAAAHIAGGLSLEDAAHLAAVRGRMFASLAGQGSMVSVAEAAAELSPRIEPWAGRVEIAAFNGPSSTILSGDEESIAEVLAQLEREGVRARRIRGAAAASHSVHIEVLREETLETFASISPRSGEIPFYSTVTGGLLDTKELDAGYWYRNLRQPVRLEQVTRELLEDGHRLMIEPSPHSVLGLAVEETIEDALGEPGAAIFLSTLRRGEGGPERMSLALAAAHAAGVEVDWGKFFAGSGAGRVPLPTYAFQRRRFWLDASTGGGDLQGAGLDSAEHPLLGAAVPVADGEGVLMTGRLSLATHPWLADHVYEAALLPGTAFIELSLRAGAEVGCETLEELTLQAPLTFPEQGGVAVQVAVSGPDEQGRRELTVLSRLDREGEEWTRHASGVLSSSPLPPPEPIGAWPPEGAQPLEVAGLYDRIAGQGLFYGQAFQCVDAAWQRGEDLFVELSLPEPLAADAPRFGLHPALLDASGHVGFDLAIEAAQADAQMGGLGFPFAWRGARYYAPGASSMRVRVSPAEEGHSIVAADAEGALVVAVDSAILRAAEPGRVRDAADRKPLYALKWSEPPPDPEGPVPGMAILGEEGIDGIEAERYESLPVLLEALEGGAEVPGAVLVASRPQAGKLLDATHEETRRVQALVRAWASLERLQGSRLVFLTEGAVATAEGERPNLASAPLLGLVRSAQSEYPGLFATIDSDGSEASSAALASALARAGEPQLALREGKLLQPRLAPVPSGAEEAAAAPIDPDSTVLITGGLSGIGARIARHLAAEHGARHLLLVSRSGEKAASAAELKAELEALGASVSVAACDVSEREQLSALLDSIPAGHPLGAVVHSAAVLEDGVLESQEADRLQRVMRPKVDAAWHLHDLTKGLELSQFLLFSSAAGLLGGAGQTSYSAANAFLDALAHLRRAEGLPATALAWGLWDQESRLAGGLTGEGGDAAKRQIRERFALLPTSPERGLRFFDAARSSPLPLIVPVQFDPGTMQAQAREGTLPAVLRDLVRVPKRRQEEGGSLAARLASLPEAERQAFCRELVRTHAAAVLGHSSAAEIEPDRAFRELGFDSLGAVELRNRLNAASGLRMPATLVFDYPTANSLGDFILSAAGGELRPSAAVSPPGPAAEPGEPIAIVGMSCRFPGGASSPQGLWDLASAGVDAIAGFPTDRGWDLERLFDPDPDKPESCYMREGGFLADAADFDSAFFAISPREAEAMDPQERLLLESCWEALEDAGVDPLSLRGTQAGVFAGVMYQDYGPLPGMTSSGVTGRIAYTFGLEGPTMSVDTACSSSLVAVHLASQALRQGECGLALAGGVAVSSTTAMLRYFSRQRGLAPDGRCKAFSEQADGTGFSEGVGVLVLERLSEAQRNGHQVLATIRGSAVNQDGASNGLTAPNGPSQERAIRQALASARLEPQDIDAVEAHGTGTPLGDPIEAGALLATYGQDREKPLKLGSLKSNIGHTQAAAGVAGVIKMVMAMREGVLPKTLHAETPSSKIDWSAGEVELLTEAAEWKPGERVRRAGISSFGATGTNAHLILEQAPEPGPAEEESPGEGSPAGAGTASPGLVPLALSAKSESALRAQAERLAAHLRDNPGLEPLDVGYSLVTSRAVFEHRAVSLGREREEHLAALAAIAAGSPAANAIVARSQGGKLAYLFSGQGSQRAGMGKELYEAFPVYREALQGAFAELDPYLDRPLAEVIFAEAGSERALLLDRTGYAQPALFATEVALYRLLESLGLVPDLLAGHSIGEISAAHLGGVLSLAGACQLVAARGRLMEALPPGGTMVAIEASEAEAEEAIAGRAAELSIAALNAPSSTVLSGEEGALEEVQAHFVELGRKTKRLAVSHAFHSPLIEPMLEEFAAVVGGIELRDPEIPVVSNTSGGLLQAGEAADPAYWVAHARQAVRFADGISTLLAQGATTFLEVGPGGALAAMARDCLEESGELGGPATAIATLRDGRPEAEAIVLALGGAHAAGAKLDWGAFFAPAPARRVPLPTYAFQRRRYWLDSPLTGGDVGGAGLRSAKHPLLGAAVDLAVGEGEATVFTGRLSLSTHPWLADHAIGGTCLVPGTALLELALEAGAQLGADTVEELTLQAPLVLPESGAVQIQISVAAPGQDEGRRQLAIHSRLDDSFAGWDLNAEGALASSPPAAPSDSLGAWPPEGAEQVETEGIYQLLADHGVEYGPSFQGLVAAWRQGDAVYAEVSLAGEQRQEAARFRIHPALLDGAAHAAIDPGEGKAGPGGLALPFAWQGVRLHAPGAETLRVRIDPKPNGASLSGFDEAGRLTISVESIVLRPLAPGDLGAASRSLYRVEWQPALPSSANGTQPRLAILGEAAIAGLEAERHDSLQAFLAAVEGGSAPDALVADFRAEGKEEAMPATALEASKQVLELAKEWIAAEAEPAARLTILTQGAVAGAEGEGPSPAAASLWGLGRAAQSEHPGRFALVDVDASSASLASLPAALAAGGEEPQLAIREGELLVPRLARAQGGEGQPATGLAGPGATVLITGGTSGFGATVARHLVATHGVRHLLLASRRGPAAPGAKELQAELEQLGAEAVRVEACDVSDRGQLKALLDSIPRSHPLGSVVHSAAVVDDGVLESLDGERLARVMQPKAEAAWHLHELTREMALSHFVLFSSVAGVLGGAAQANYAAANAFLDGLAARRQAEGLAATSLAWGALAVESGLVAGGQAEEIAGRLRLRLGLVPMPQARALALLDTTIELGEAQVAPVEFDWPALRARAKDGSVAPLLRGLLRVANRPEGESGSLAERLAGLPEDEREAFVLDLVCRHAAAVLGHASVEAVEPDRAFQELGFDSLAAVELRNRLGASAGIHLPPTLVFDYPSAAAIAGYLLAEVSPGRDDSEDAEEGAFREALARVPLSRLREAGLMEDLIEIAGFGGGSAKPLREGSIEQIDSMDAADLIELARADAEPQPAGGGEA
jgi:acyl transferase domain-containing protein/NAD(P)-dependent dehydrogenase (short-subunit alcohol dehydrogenase family)/acyl carrier protein